jgi:prepilin-type N-terminal cleavage/methylation domain-containing protein
MCHLISRLWRQGEAQREARGYTLIELMVAMALTLVVLGVAFVLFDHLYSVSEVTGAMADVNQNLRASINLVARDLTSAGAGVPIGGIPLPGGSGSSAVLRPGPGTNYFPTGTGVLSAITPGYGLSGNINGRISDEVTMVRVDPQQRLEEYPLTSIITVTTPVASTHIQVDSGTNIASGPSAVSVGDLIMLSNANGMALGVVTAVDTTNNWVFFDGGDALGLNQPGAASGNIQSLKNPGTGTYPPTYAYKMLMITYYLDASVANNPRLMSQFGVGTPSVVANGITGLQFSYDTSDGVTMTPNQRDIPTGHSANEIRKVNLLVSGQSAARGRKTRQFFSNTFTTGVTIRNLAYRDKY